MEELKFSIYIYCFVGMALCLTFIFIISKFEKKHPNLFNDKCTTTERKQYNQLVVISVNVILLYVIFAIFGLTLITTSKPSPIVLLACMLLMGAVVINIVKNLKKN